MEIIKCGTLAKMTLNNTECMVTATEIRFAKITYQLTYFYGGDHKTIWVDESEFTVLDPEKTKIGFK